MTEEAKIYELGFLLKPELTEEKIPEENQKIKTAVEDNHGLVLNGIQPKLHQLAYPIKKLENAYFGWLAFSLKPEDLESLGKTLKQNTSLVRYLITTGFKPKQSEKKVSWKTQLAPTKTEKETIKSKEIDKKLEEILG
jgi:ribosomal protein S6